MKIRPAWGIFFVAAIATGAAFAQETSGFKAEYLNEFDATAKHLMQLAEAMPADKFGWRPGPGVRSVSEVYVHIASGNFLMLAVTGQKLPAEYFPDAKPAANGEPDLRAIVGRMRELEKSVTNKDDVIKMLKTSIDDVRTHFSSSTQADMDRPVSFFGDQTTVRGIYLRALAHLNEHYGQSVAYARVNGIVPPWSK